MDPLKPEELEKPGRKFLNDTYCAEQSDDDSEENFYDVEPSGFDSLIDHLGKLSLGSDETMNGSSTRDAQSDDESQGVSVTEEEYQSDVGDMMPENVHELSADYPANQTVTLDETFSEDQPNGIHDASSPQTLDNISQNEMKASFTAENSCVTQSVNRTIIIRDDSEISITYTGPFSPYEEKISNDSSSEKSERLDIADMTFIADGTQHMSSGSLQDSDVLVEPVGIEMISDDEGAASSATSDEVHKELKNSCKSASRGEILPDGCNSSGTQELNSKMLAEEVKYPSQDIQGSVQASDFKDAGSYDFKEESKSHKATEQFRAEMEFVKHPEERNSRSSTTGVEIISEIIQNTFTGSSEGEAVKAELAQSETLPEEKNEASSMEQKTYLDKETDLNVAKDNEFKNGFVDVKDEEVQQNPQNGCKIVSGGEIFPDGRDSNGTQELNLKVLPEEGKCPSEEIQGSVQTGDEMKPCDFKEESNSCNETERIEIVKHLEEKNSRSSATDVEIISEIIQSTLSCSSEKKAVNTESTNSETLQEEENKANNMEQKTRLDKTADQNVAKDNEFNNDFVDVKDVEVHQNPQNGCKIVSGDEIFPDGRDSNGTQELNLKVLPEDGKCPSEEIQGSVQTGDEMKPCDFKEESNSSNETGRIEIVKHLEEKNSQSSTVDVEIISEIMLNTVSGSSEGETVKAESAKSKTLPEEKNEASNVEQKTCLGKKSDLKVAEDNEFKNGFVEATSEEVHQNPQNGCKIVSGGEILPDGCDTYETQELNLKVLPEEEKYPSREIQGGDVMKPCDVTEGINSHNETEQNEIVKHLEEKDSQSSTTDVEFISEVIQNTLSGSSEEKTVKADLAMTETFPEEKNEASSMEQKTYLDKETDLNVAKDNEFKNGFVDVKDVEVHQNPQNGCKTVSGGEILPDGCDTYETQELNLKVLPEEEKYPSREIHGGDVMKPCDVTEGINSHNETEQIEIVKHLEEKDSQSSTTDVEFISEVIQNTLSGSSEEKTVKADLAMTETFPEEKNEASSMEQKTYLDKETDLNVAKDNEFKNGFVDVKDVEVHQNPQNGCKIVSEGEILPDGCDTYETQDLNLKVLPEEEKYPSREIQGGDVMKPCDVKEGINSHNETEQIEIVKHLEEKDSQSSTTDVEFISKVIQNTLSGSSEEKTVKADLAMTETFPEEKNEASSMEQRTYLDKETDLNVAKDNEFKNSFVDVKDVEVHQNLQNGCKIVSEGEILPDGCDSNGTREPNLKMSAEEERYPSQKIQGSVQTSDEMKVCDVNEEGSSHKETVQIHEQIEIVKLLEEKNSQSPTTDVEINSEIIQNTLSGSLVGEAMKAELADSELLQELNNMQKCSFGLKQLDKTQTNSPRIVLKDIQNVSFSPRGSSSVLEKLNTGFLGEKKSVNDSIFLGIKGEDLENLKNTSLLLESSQTKSVVEKIVLKTADKTLNVQPEKSELRTALLKKIEEEMMEKSQVGCANGNVTFLTSSFGSEDVKQVNRSIVKEELSPIIKSTKGANLSEISENLSEIYISGRTSIMVPSSLKITQQEATESLLTNLSSEQTKVDNTPKHSQSKNSDEPLRNDYQSPVAVEPNAAVPEDMEMEVDPEDDDQFESADKFFGQDAFKDPGAFDFLLGLGSSRPARDLRKESLYMKFDPLVGSPRNSPRFAMLQKCRDTLESQAVNTGGCLLDLSWENLAEESRPKESPTSECVLDLGAAEKADITINTVVEMSKTPVRCIENTNQSTPVVNYLEKTTQSMPAATKYVEKTTQSTPVATKYVEKTTQSTPAAAKYMEKTTQSTPAAKCVEKTTQCTPLRMPSPVLKADASEQTSEQTVPCCNCESYCESLRINEEKQKISQDELENLKHELAVFTEMMISQERTYQEDMLKLKEKVKQMEFDAFQSQQREQHLLKQISEANVKENKLQAIMDEYEKTVAMLVTDKERIQEELSQSNIEVEELRNHLNMQEISFSDLHMKYEKIKTQIIAFQKNEEELHKRILDYEVAVRMSDKRYETLKEHASAQLESANHELMSVRQNHHSELSRLKAIVKKSELRISSLEEAIAQKTKENQELMSICDELIGKVGHSDVSMRT